MTSFLHQQRLYPYCALEERLSRYQDDEVELRSLIQVKLKSAAKAAQLKDMKRMSRDMIEEALCNAFITEYYAATDDKKDSSVSFVKIKVTETVHNVVPDKTPIQNFNRWLQ